MFATSFVRRAGLCCVCLLAATAAAAADGYRLPPEEVVAVVDAPPPPLVSYSPDGAWMLLVERAARPTIADLARPMLRLAGMRIDPATNGRWQADYDRGLVLRSLADGGERRVPLQEGARIDAVTWSQDARRFAFTLASDAGTALWCATVDAPQEPRRLTERLNALFGAPRWMPEGRVLLCLLVPEDRGAPPAAERVPAGPNVQQTSGEATPLRTYQDLLQSAHDEELFAYYATSQLALVSSETGTRTTIGEPDLYRSAEPSPEGAHLLVTTIERPFSWLMPWYRFGHAIRVLGPGGREEAVIARNPLAESVPIGGVITGPRMVDWRPGEPATVVWAEALDGGDPDREAAARDRWLSLAAPFTDAPRELLRVEHRARGLDFTERAQLVLSHEYDRDRRWTRTTLHDLALAEARPQVVEDRSVRDRYGDPGDLVMVRDASGKRVVRLDGPWMYRAGDGASPDGLLPFLDRQNVETLATERLWRCEPGAYERVAEVLPGSGERVRFTTIHEDPESPPNHRLRTAGTGEARPLTDFPDPTPQLRGIARQLVTYERADGVALSATLYLPAGYEQGQRLPLFVWAYPLEYGDADTAGQIGVSPWRFTRIAGSSHLVLLTQGWAVLDGATMPVIGDPETMNDTFVEQIVAAARAAIDAAVELGVAEPGRVAVGGHSYGAFMAANLLAHCDLFAAGVARSGAYNRALTPFGFQSERRTLWEAPDTYVAVSPYFHADKIDEPLLLIHGEADANSGTFPMQSERLFQAIKGNGGTARLVMLPEEAHGYRARESILHVHAETIDWLTEHVARR